MKIGLVGFPGCGKSTVFNALTGLSVDTGYGAKSAKPSYGVVKVPDARVDALAELYHPKKKVYAEVTFVDLAAGGTQGGLDRAALNSMRDVDALCQVVRAFPDPGGDSPDPVRGIADLEAETILADLELVERRIERLVKEHSSPREVELLTRIRQHLEAEQSIRTLEMSPEEIKMISGYRFLSQKPLLLVLNVTEDEIAAPPPPSVVAAAEQRGLGLVVLSAQVEMDIAHMPEDEQREFLEAMGLKKPAVERFITAAFALLDLISMLTAGPDECRAWPVARNSPMPRAAGKIHSDMERGFIRAEVIKHTDLLELGSEAKCREQGKLRIEGKDYVVQDGDVVNIRFNV